MWIKYLKKNQLTTFRMTEKLKDSAYFKLRKDVPSKMLLTRAIYNLTFPAYKVFES